MFYNDTIITVLLFLTEKIALLNVNILTQFPKRMMGNNWILCGSMKLFNVSFTLIHTFCLGKAMFKLKGFHRYCVRMNSGGKYV